MNPPRRRVPLRPGVEPLEGRIVLSAMAAPGPRVVAMALNLADGSGAGAILGALSGGAGSEFVTLLRRGGTGLPTVLRQFVAGTRTEYAVKGFAIKAPHFQSQYTGPHLDQYNPTAAGAVLQKNGRLELAAILRGPIDLPNPVTYTWGIDRGGATADPEGLGLPGLKYDAIVSVTRTGSALSASVKDLKTGAITALDPSSVNINGPTIRVFLSNPSSLLPSTGLPISKYNFAFYTRSAPGGIANVGGFVPSSGSIPIGVLATRRALLR